MIYEMAVCEARHFVFRRGAGAACPAASSTIEATRKVQAARGAGLAKPVEK